MATELSSGGKWGIMLTSNKKTENLRPQLTHAKLESACPTPSILPAGSSLLIGIASDFTRRRKIQLITARRDNLSRKEEVPTNWQGCTLETAGRAATDLSSGKKVENHVDVEQKKPKTKVRN